MLIIHVNLLFDLVLFSLISDSVTYRISRFLTLEVKVTAIELTEILE